MAHTIRDHLPPDVTDPGLIQGTCSDCGTIIYSVTTATVCHRAGDWMRTPRPEAYPFLDRDEIRAREKNREKTARRNQKSKQ